MVVCFDKWVEYKRREERSFSMFIQSFLELTDEQFTYIPTHLHNRYLFEMTEEEGEKKETSLK
jgi:hypothetical protein